MITGDHTESRNLAGHKKSQSSQQGFMLFRMRRSLHFELSGKTPREQHRSRQAISTCSASNPVVQPRFGDTSLALGDRGEHR